MSSFAYERVHHSLKRLKLTTIDSLMDNYLEIASKENQSTLEVLDYLFDQELKTKEDRALGLRMRMAGFPMEKRLDDFDLSFQPSLDPAVLKDLASLRFIHNAENVVFLGPPGVGKTHLALALGYEAVKHGFRVYFANASNLIERLVKAKHENKLEERIKGLTKFHLLIVAIQRGRSPLFLQSHLEEIREVFYNIYLKQVVWGVGRNFRRPCYRCGGIRQDFAPLFHAQYKR